MLLAQISDPTKRCPFTHLIIEMVTKITLLYTLVCVTSNTRNKKYKNLPLLELQQKNIIWNHRSTCQIEIQMIMSPPTGQHKTCFLRN